MDPKTIVNSYVQKFEHVKMQKKDRSALAATVLLVLVCIDSKILMFF